MLGNSCSSLFGKVYVLCVTCKALPLKKMNDRLKIDRDASQGNYYAESVRAAYKAAGHFPHVPAALADPKHRASVTLGVDGFELMGVDILHNVSSQVRSIMCGNFTAKLQTRCSA